MVNKKHENKDQDDLEITNDITEMIEPDLEEVEMREKDVISSLREKFKTCDAQKRELLEETQRIKADFLNARQSFMTTWVKMFSYWIYCINRI